MRIRTAIGAAVAGVLACWVAAPLVSLARTGTIDQRTAVGCRAGAVVAGADLRRHDRGVLAV